MKKISSLFGAPALSCVSLLFTLHFLLFTFNSNAQGVTKYGQSTATSTDFVDKTGKIGNVALLDRYGKTLIPCPSTLTINHTAGAVAPATLSITYGVVTTSLSGSSKCWITQNLGASTQAASATDATDASAGWYWQFNRNQGYAVGPNPAWTITTFNESSNWAPVNDPCSIELGAGWRIPTHTEWQNADVNGAWANYTDAYNSVLKLHAAGYLKSSDGTLLGRGANGLYWSSTEVSTTGGWILNISSSASSGANTGNKAGGSSLRCLKD